MNKSSLRRLAGLLVLTVLLAAAPLAPAEEAPNVTQLMNSYTELDLSGQDGFYQLLHRMVLLLHAGDARHQNPLRHLQRG